MYDNINSLFEQLFKKVLSMFKNSANYILNFKCAYCRPHDIESVFQKR